MTRFPPWLSALVGIAVLAHAAFWLGASLPIHALATFAITGFIPGWLFVHLLFRQTISSGERILYSIAAGYAVMVIGMLVLSYLPGGISQLHVLGLFNSVAVGLFLVVHFTKKNAGKPGQLQVPVPSILLLVAGISLLLIAGILRFTNIGYAEFHNDEARAVLRAAAVIQGSEDVLFIHKKGPTEILIPAVIYAVTGHLNEAAARLPFAVANLTALFGVWLLGWRLFGAGKVGHAAGFSAALLLALDGYFIGFSRIVQYQSVVFMTTVLTVAIFAKLWRAPRNLIAHMILAAVFMALGLLSHYEAGLAMMPVFALLGGLFLSKRRNQCSQGFTFQVGATAILVATLIGVALLSLFYFPYLTHPQFSATYTYLTERRIGGAGLPYNNLADVFSRTTVYSTTYYLGLLVLLTLLGFAVALRRAFTESSLWQGKGKRAYIPRLLTTLFAVSLVLFFSEPTWLTIRGQDWGVLPFLLGFGIVWILPRMALGERIIWLWFGGLFLLAIFGTLKPRTHVYVFFIPWALLVGWILAQLWERLTQSLGARNGNLIGLIFLSIFTVLFGNYTYRYFVQNQPEVLRTWSENRPVGYWAAYEEPDKRALFGFPSSNGWKVVGQLYAQDEIEGNFETNELEAWGPAWYTRGQVRCKHNADWYFQTVSNLEPFYDFQRVAMEDFLSKGFAPWGKVMVNGVHKMTIHRRMDNSIEPLPEFELNEYLTAFDQYTSPDLALTYPVVNQPIPNPLHINLANLFWLEGYAIEHPEPLRAGNAIRLTLFWRAQQPTEKTYKIFNQAYYGEGTMVAQRDGHPVCGNRDTWQWDPGELITDMHEVPVLSDAPDGLYPLVTGMYELDSGERLAVIGDDGNASGNQIHLTDIRIGVE